MRWVVAAVCLSACASSDSLTCPSGVVCPAGTECRAVGGFDVCATDADITACNGVVDGGGCDESNDRRRCADGVCVDTCGNLRMESYEECDDGNATGGDGCSRTCLMERCGNGELDLAIGEECDSGPAGVSGDGCSSGCRLESPVWDEIVQAGIEARAWHAMAYDPIHQEVVMFGGITSDGLVGDTWVWSGASATWRRRDPARSPSPRFGHAMSYDAERGVVVLFGGYTSAGYVEDTWVWDGLIWTERTPAQDSPFRRMNAAMAYDPVRKITLLAGGTTSNGNLANAYEWNGTAWISKQTLVGPLNAETGGWYQLAYDATANEMIWVIGGIGTYRYDQTAWTQLTTAYPGVSDAGSPSRIVYDPRRQTLVAVAGNGDVFEWNRGTTTWDDQTDETITGGAYRALADDGTQLLLFGGAAGGVPLDPAGLRDTTFRRSGTATSTFQEVFVFPIVAPPVVFGAVAMDTKRQRAVTYGGIAAGGIGGSTWLFDHAGWTPLNASTGEGRFEHAMAYDAERDAVVLFGGRSLPSSPPYTFLAATRVFKNNAWTNPAPAAQPSARRDTAMAYDAARKQVVLFGGDADMSGFYNLLADTWVWDGVTWTQKFPTTSPPSRSQALIAYDPERERVVLFGGSNGALTYAQDTWEWDGANWTVTNDGNDPQRLHPPGRGAGSLVWDPLRHRIVLFGGGAINYDGAHHDDVWEYNAGTWTLVHEDGRLARARQLSFYDTVRGGLVTYGGQKSVVTGSTNETWILRYVSSTPRETCRLPEDDLDHDELAGCEDPDCAPRCSACGNGTCEPYEDVVICPTDC